MADFCRDCTLDLFEVEGWSDLPAGWQLCEGCGTHYLTTDGRRLCQKPTPDEAEVTDLPCVECATALDLLV